MSGQPDHGEKFDGYSSCVFCPLAIGPLLREEVGEEMREEIDNPPASSRSTEANAGRQKPLNQPSIHLSLLSFFGHFPVGLNTQK